jgi:hypothetical protein
VRNTVTPSLTRWNDPRQIGVFDANQCVSQQGAVFIRAKEKVMDQQPTPHPDYESLTWILNSVAQWVIKYRRARDICDDLTNCGADEFANIARDLRLQPSELAILARKGPDAANLLRDLLNALGIDASNLERDEPLVMRDLERLCTTCHEKRQCRFHLANGIIADNFRDFCPNAFTLDALLQEKEQRA